MKKEPGGTLGKKFLHRAVYSSSLKPIPCTGQGEPGWRTALAQLLCSWVLPGAWVPLPPVPSHGDRPALSAQSRGDARLSTAPETEVPAQHPLSPPHLAPPGPLSSFSGLENAAQGGKFQQAAEHLAKLTKDLCIVCLIHGHFGIPILKPQSKSHKSHFHLDPRLLFPPNAP